MIIKYIKKKGTRPIYVQSGNQSGKKEEWRGHISGTESIPCCRDRTVYWTARQVIVLGILSALLPLHHDAFMFWRPGWGDDWYQGVHFSTCLILRNVTIWMFIKFVAAYFLTRTSITCQALNPRILTPIHIQIDIHIIYIIIFIYSVQIYIHTVVSINKILPTIINTCWCNQPSQHMNPSPPSPPLEMIIIIATFRHPNRKFVAFHDWLLLPSRLIDSLPYEVSFYQSQPQNANKETILLRDSRIRR